jgi:alanine racemase
MSSARGPLSKSGAKPRSDTEVQAPPGPLAPSRPAWVEISTSALIHNYRFLRDRAASFGAQIICVIKANAYGHGVIGVTRVLVAAGAKWFAVTSVDEGMEIVRQFRENGQPLDLESGRILIFSGVFNVEDAWRAIRHQLTPVLLSLQQLEWLAEAVRVNTPRNKKYIVHLEIDTGMGRNGVRWDDKAQLDAIGELLGTNPNLRVEAVMTHFASPDDPSSPQTAQQIHRFRLALEHLDSIGVRPPILHAGNSLTLVEPSQTDALVQLAHTYGATLLLRPGLALYGYGVSDVEPVLTWKTRITSLRRLQAGDGVSYNATFHTTRSSLVATLATGYADGYNRLLSNKGSVLIRGERAAVLGRVTMDQLMVDVTNIEDVAVGDEAVLLGTQAELTISAAQIATLTNTIAWEVLCDIGERVNRVLVD